jgi:UDP-3-O-[3-hydroxymyristoyl] N-acetylglucosamine deacetylase
MSVLNQKTIKKNIVLDGVALHSGKMTHMEIKPSQPNSGIIFKRTDLKSNNIIIPGVFNVSSAVFCTTISNDYGVKISTIEHLMGAFYGMGIDNALVEIDGDELPILDGSAKSYVQEISNSGVEFSNSPIKIIKIENKITLKEGKKFISLEPSKLSLDIDFEIVYKNSLIGTQRNLVKVYEDDLTDVFNSRTFCVYDDIEKLKKMNLAKGGSLENAIVVNDKKVLNKDGLRNKLEFVNHKILDCIGDLYLSGYKIIGKLKCSQGGHKLTNQLLRRVFENDTNFSIIEVKENKVPHSFINKRYLKSIA